MSFLSNLVQKICQPVPSKSREDFQTDLAFYQNKKILFASTLIIVSLSIYSFAVWKIYSSLSPVYGLAANLLLYIVFLVACRSHMGLYKALYFWVVCLSGPILVHYSPDSIVFNLTAVHIMPLWILYIIGVRAFLLSTVMQLVYLHMFYKYRILETLINMTPELYMKRILFATTFAVVLNTSLIFGIQYDIKKAHQEAEAERVKKSELERQKTFLLSFSHEIRNLINTMIGSVQLSLLEHIPQKVQDLLHNSEICGELLLHLVNNILDTGKVEIGELEVNPTPKVVSETLEKVWSICAQLIKSKNLNGQMRIQTKLPRLLKIDSYRLMQILMNMIGNSIKFTDSGSIGINIDWLEGEAQVTNESFEPVPFDEIEEGVFEKRMSTDLLSKNILFFDLKSSKMKKESFADIDDTEKGVLKIIVSDTGSGISQDKIPLLFSKFGQVSNDPTKRKMGTGLGLFITKQLVEKMGGEIRVFSKEKKGTVMIICIPTESVKDTAQKALTIEAFTNLAETKLLQAMIVDDAQFNQVVLKSILAKIGVQVRAVASNGRESIEKFISSIAQGQPINLITMDIEMPVMNGKEAVEKIRKLEMKHRLKPCLTIIVSANCSESEIAECTGIDHKTGLMKANYFLKKPASMNDLFGIIQSQFLSSSLNSTKCEI